jgi:hypothetical protein
MNNKEEENYEFKEDNKKKKMRMMKRTTKISKIQDISGNRNYRSICKTTSRISKRDRVWMRMHLKKKKSTWNLAVLILRRRIQMRRSM